MDYPEPVAADWPDLLEIVERLVKPERDKVDREARRLRWWRYGDRQPGLYSMIGGLDYVLVTNCGASPHLSFARTTARAVFANSLEVFSLSAPVDLGILQSRPHEIWARFFSSSMKDDLRYAPTDCFENFPFPDNYSSNTALDAAGQAYLDYRAQLMIDTNKGLTPTYNRFHDSYDDDPAIQRLRDLHAEMDRAVLRAYGWNDLADAANPVFLTEETETEFTYQRRLFWPSDFRDEVLAKLLELNRERHAVEANAGIAIATAPDAPHSATKAQLALGTTDGPLIAQVFDRTEE